MIELIAAVDEKGDVKAEVDGSSWCLLAGLESFGRMPSSAVVMGWAVAESLSSPLPGVVNMVISDHSYPRRGFEQARTFEESLYMVIRELRTSAVIIGCSALYAAAMATDGRLPNIVHIARIGADEPAPGHRALPQLGARSYELAGFETHPPDMRHAYPFDYELWRGLKIPSLSAAADS